MICEYCGSQIPDDAKTCPFCDAECAKGSDPVAHEPVASLAPTPAPVSAQAVPVPQKKKSRLPLIIGAAAVVVILAVVGIFALGGKGVSAPQAAKEAMQDASTLAAELADRYEGYESNATSGDSGDEVRTYDMAYEEITGAQSRLQADMDSLKAAGENWEGYQKAQTAMQNVMGALDYELAVLETQHNAVLAGPKNGGTALKMIEALYEGYAAIDPPDCLKEYVACTVSKLPAMYDSLVYAAGATPSTLSQYCSNELMVWWTTKQGAYDAEGMKIMVTQCRDSHDMLDSLTAGKAPADKPEVGIDAISQIAPNLYPSLDSAVIVDATSFDDDHSVTVSAEVVGFTQKFEQKYNLKQGYNYLPIKPALLPTTEITNLSSNTTTQLDVKVIDDATGNVLAQESQEVELLSMYDFMWENDEFGSTAAFDILAWLRPQADEVNAINRSAAEILGKWTNGKYKSIAGYQYGKDVFSTLIQVAAIQAAISQADVAYVMDAYSFKANQHILTPDQVVQKKQGLCIETSLLMASCLLSANMHPLIIITPSHAQVAVESYSGSGNYFLIETTRLPYSGIDTSYSETQAAFYNGLLATMKAADGTVRTVTTTGSSEEWQAYFDAKKDKSDEFGGIFVIDCYLQRDMDIQGLENM